MWTEQTITVEQALSSDYTLATDQESTLKKTAKQREKQLRKFLLAQYDEFYQTFLADEEESMQGSFIEVRPDPEDLPIDPQTAKGQLKHIIGDELQFGRRVVYFDAMRIYAGRVEEVKQLKKIALDTIFEVTLLEADDH